MSTVKLVAATGRPLNNTGYLVPVFQKRNNKCFTAGNPRKPDFPASSLNRLAREKSITLFTPVRPKGTGFRVSDLRWCGVKPDRYGFPAFVLYFSKKAVACLGGNEILESMCSANSAVQTFPGEGASKDFREYVFSLISRECLVSGFVPEMIELCSKKIDDILANRILSAGDSFTDLVVGEQDDLAQLAQIMMNIADGGRNLDDAISYYGAMLLRSPQRKNFPVWLGLVLDQLGHAIQDREYWKQRAFGIIDAAQGKAKWISALREKQIIYVVPAVQPVRKRLGSAISLPVQTAGSVVSHQTYYQESDRLSAKTGTSVALNATSEEDWLNVVTGHQLAPVVNAYTSSDILSRLKGTATDENKPKSRAYEVQFAGDRA